MQSGSTSDLDSKWRGKRVVLVPGVGWDSNPLAPEARGHYKILGGVKGAPCGTLSEYVAVEEKQVVLCPGYLSQSEAAAFPLAGLTAYRALFTKGGVKSGSKILITGIGGGVGLAALLLAVSAGAEVYVTSSSEQKIERAKKLGAKDGILYTVENWSRELKKRSGELDVVLDSAGGDIVSQATPLLKQGGTIVTYGMTLGPKTYFTMQAVLKVLSPSHPKFFRRPALAVGVGCVRGADGRISTLRGARWGVPRNSSSCVNSSRRKGFRSRD